MLGVIGRNGAGKSTLLKLLTRITTPTERPGRDPRAGRQPARGRDRFPSRAHRPRERLPQRLGPRDEAHARSAGKFDEIVELRRRRAVHRHAREAVLERDVRAARVRSRRASRAGDPARRRGARGRRRRVPATLPRPDAGLRRSPDARCSSSRTTCRRLRGLCERDDPARGRARSSRDGAERRRRRPLPPVGHGTGSYREWPETDHASGRRRRRDCARSRVVQDGQTVDTADVRRPIGIELAFRVLSATTRSFPKIKLVNRRGRRSSSTRSTPIPAGTMPLPPGDYVATAWIPREHAQRGLLHRRRRDVFSRSARSCCRTPANRQAVSFHVHDPGEGDSARGRFTGQLAGRRPAAARVDASRSASARMTARSSASSSSGTRTCSSSRQSATSPASATASTRSTTSPQTRPGRSSRALERDYPHLDARRSHHAGDSHTLLEPYAGTDTWVFGVDGDELYDAARLARFSRGPARRRLRRRLQGRVERAQLRRARPRAATSVAATSLRPRVRSRSSTTSPRSTRGTATGPNVSTAARSPSAPATTSSAVDNIGERHPVGRDAAALPAWLLSPAFELGPATVGRPVRTTDPRGDTASGPQLARRSQAPATSAAPPGRIRVEAGEVHARRPRQRRRDAVLQLSA